MVMAAAANGGDHELVLQLHDEVMAMAPGPASNRCVRACVCFFVNLFVWLVGNTTMMDVRACGGGPPMQQHTRGWRHDP